MTISNIHLYRPSNGTEGASFIETWCGNCKRDRVCNGTVLVDDARDEDYCPILGASFANDIDSPDFPREWQYGADGAPCCTAFEEMDAPEGPSLAVRDERTDDMFGSQA